MGVAGRKQIPDHPPQHEGVRRCSSPRGGIQKEEVVVGGMERSSSLTRLSLSYLRNILLEAQGGSGAQPGLEGGRAFSAS